VIAIDGKTVRGARTASKAAPHLVSAFDHASGTVLGQLATAAKSNEIPAVRALLAGFDLAGVVVTVDAMHTQADTATAITGAGGDYVFTVKANQPGLYAACKRLPWRHVGEHSTVTTGHGRRVRRTIKVVAVPAWITFAEDGRVETGQDLAERRGIRRHAPRQSQLGQLHAGQFAGPLPDRGERASTGHHRGQCHRDDPRQTSLSISTRPAAPGSCPAGCSIGEDDIGGCGFRWMTAGVRTTIKTA
jgi:hypothetical protein